MLALLTAGCAVSPDDLTQENINRANKTCETQVKFDQALGMRTWFTRWLACKQEHVMPFEIKAYPDKEAQIRDMYTKLIDQGAQVDAGVIPVQVVYREWERIQIEIGMRRCLVRVENRDGSSQCAVH